MAGAGNDQTNAHQKRTPMADGFRGAQGAAQRALAHGTFYLIGSRFVSI